MAKKLNPIYFQRVFTRKNFRKFCLNVHLVIALTVGFVFVILGLTGSCNAFYYELQELDLPAVTNASKAQPRSLDDVLQTVKAAHPQRTGGWSIMLPGYLSDYVWVEYRTPEETIDKLYAPLEILVDPYTGIIVDQHFWGQTLVSLVYEVHATFLTGLVNKKIGQIGFDVICFLGIFLFISCLSGIYLWWPQTRKVKQALTIKPHASRERLVFDLHKTTGFYSSVLLLVIAFSGFSFGYSDYLKPLVNIFSTVKADHLKTPSLKSTPVPEAQTISIAQAIAVANQIFPEAELRSIGTPENTEGVYMVAKKQTGEANSRAPRSKVWIDQYSGRVLAIQNPSEFTAGGTLFNLMWPLHDGQALGLPGRFLWCIVGFAPLVLYVTGILRWLQKRRAKRLNTMRRDT